MQALERNCLPVVAASDALQAAFRASSNSEARLLAEIEADYGFAYAALAHPFRAQVVGSLLAISCLGSNGSGLYSQQMLTLRWNASFAEEATSSVPLWVEAAYSFALCANASRQRQGEYVAETMLNSLRARFPLPDAGVFDLKDIDNLVGGTHAA